MAPTGQKTPVSKYIVDLDSATTNGKKLKRIKSINNTAVWRPAKCVAAATQENDDLNPRETTDKLFLEEEDDLEDGSLVDTSLPLDITSLCGVSTSSKTPGYDSVSAVTSLDQSCPTKSLLRTWRSSGKGKKRKKKKAGHKKKIHKRQKTDISMASASESIRDTIKVPFVFDVAEATVYNTYKNMYVDCKRSVTHGQHKTSAESGYVATQQPCGSMANGNRYCSTVHAHRGGAGGGGDGDGDSGDDRKPPRKPPDGVPDRNTGRQKKKKKKTSSGMEVDDEDENEHNGNGSAEITDMDVSCEKSNGNQQEVSDQRQQQKNLPHAQAEQPPQAEVAQIKKLQILGKFNGDINHYNASCKKKPCERCNWVETTLIKHHLEETRRACGCTKCKLCLCVLNYHSGICKVKYCNICARLKKTPKPASAAVNIPQTTPSLDQTAGDDRVVWQDGSFSGISHFKEDLDYMFLNDSVVGKGGHGAVHDVKITDDFKQKYFNSDCIDFVMKKADKVGKDEKYMFAQTSGHPSLVETYLVVQKMQGSNSKEHFRILMEKCERSLKDHINSTVGKRLDIYESMFYWTQILDVLKFLHHLRIPLIHKDIKAENVLLTVKDNYVRAKLADYDTVKQLPHAYTKPGIGAVGTPGFISPEVLQLHAHGRPADVWNMGMFLLQMLFAYDFTKLQLKILDPKNKSTFVQRTEEMTQKFLEEKIPELKQMDSELADLIQSCLKSEPDERPTAADLLQHPAVTKYMDKDLINMDELVRQISSDLMTP